MRLKRAKPTYLFCGVIIFLSVFFGALVKFAPAMASSEAEETKSASPKSHFVTIFDDGKKLTIKTDAVTVREVLERMNIEVANTDKVEPGLTSIINDDNYSINIYRARPVLVIDGASRQYVYTPSYDGRSIAEDAGVTVYDGDEVEMIENQNFLETGDAVAYSVTRNGGRTVTVESSIPYAEKEVEDDTLEAGKEKVQQVGEDGTKTAVYQVNFVNGVEVSRELISEQTTKEPVEKITAVGTKENKAETTKKATTTIRPEWETCAGWAREAGVSEADLYDALTLIYHESGCRVNATNSSSGAYGIPQALPGSKMAVYGDDWETKPVTQIRWMANYVTKRYGGWSQAIAFWNSHRWY